MKPFNDLRHVIVEGPDAGGKDTLIRSLRKHPKTSGLVMHPRASTSLGGPVDSLAEWVSNDVRTMEEQPPSIYNRHPLISEPIYSDYRTVKRPQDPEWSNPAWYDAMTWEAAKYCLLVVCVPPFQTVHETIWKQGPNAHMPGVAENIRQIHARYKGIYHERPGSPWPGIVIRYDYTWHSDRYVSEQIHAYMKGMNS